MAHSRQLCIDLRWIDSSGVGIYIQGILPGLVELLPDVTITGLGKVDRLREFDWSRASNVRLVDCRSERYSMAEQAELPRAIPRGTDLFFSPYYTVPLFYRGKLAVTVHDMSHLVVEEITGNWKKHLYAKTMYAAIRRRASVVFTVSDFSRNEFYRITGSPQTLPVITTHLGVAEEWNLLKRNEGNGRPYFVCVGNIKPYKNLKRLVQAYLQVKDRIGHDLVIIGQKEGLITGEGPEFFSLVEQGGERIRMTGYVEHEELLSLVANADALLMPSLYEGFGLPPLEAMAAGVPAAISRAASLPEVCGDAALYFDPLSVEDMAAALVRLATEPELRDALRAAGRERVKAFSWKRCTQLTANGLLKAMS